MTNEERQYVAQLIEKDRIKSDMLSKLARTLQEILIRLPPNLQALPSVRKAAVLSAQIAKQFEELAP
jgi:hypothetical protein